MLSIIETCKVCGVDAEAYIAEVTERCGAAINVRARIASPWNAPERSFRCLTIMFPWARIQSMRDRLDCRLHVHWAEHHRVCPFLPPDLQAALQRAQKWIRI